ncbi:MOSC domain-containing protein [Rhizosaccharibacter radicis]|uniref:MOSC domain-containing protein n=1 Tax=Rhizosaccharibacter radicis TaxID=2782605 RepID=A0ABT1VXC1_9PROT|nr:MOSC domain-containing protein [Acetobacteraceae bacterium KSS12]
MSAVISGLHIYPVKGLRGVALPEAAVTPLGLEGDRRWMVVSPEGNFRSQRQTPGMALIDAVPEDGALSLRCGDDVLVVPRPDGNAENIPVEVWGTWMQGAAASPNAGEWLSERLGQSCRLVFMRDEQTRPVEAAHNGGEDHVSFADAFPLLATGAASLDALNEALEADGVPAVPMDRFRPNIVVEGLAPWAEDGWRRVRVGEVVFRMPKPCTRCVVVTRDQRTGETPVAGQPLRTLGRLNRNGEGIVFGANLIPETAGTVRLGDPVEALD